MSDFGKVIDAMKVFEVKLNSSLTQHEQLSKDLASGTSKSAQQLADLENKHSSLERELKDMLTDMSKKYEEVDKYLIELKSKMVHPDARANGPVSLGAAFVESAEFKQYLSTAAPGQAPMGNMQQDVQIKGGLSRGTLGGRVAGSLPRLHKDITGGVSDLLNVFAVDKIQQIFFDPMRQSRVRDLFPVLPTTSNSIEFISELLYTNNTAAIDDGDASPVSNFSFEQDVQTVKTLTHWTPLSRNLLADVPALGPYIDLRLMEGLKEVEDDQLLYGDGSGPNIQGIMVTPGVQVYNQSSGETTDTRIDTLRRAMTKAQLAYYMVSAYILNPIDWEHCELTKSTIRDYVWVNVGTGADPTLWKIPVITTTAMNEGEYLTGSFNRNAAIWDREQAYMRVTDAHSNLWILNQLAIGLWERIALTVFRPPAFVRGAFDGAPAS